MPAHSQSLYFTVGTDANKNPIKASSITYPPASFMPTTVQGPQTYYSDREKGDGYYGGAGLHTVTYNPWPKQNYTSVHVINNFEGNIVMQATLVTDPLEEDWFDIDSTRTVFNESFNTNKFHNFYGNFVWIRAKVVIERGVLQSILYNH
jgi:hypothetical protein